MKDSKYVNIHRVNKSLYLTIGIVDCLIEEKD